MMNYLYSFNNVAHKLEVLPQYVLGLPSTPVLGRSSLGSTLYEFKSYLQNFLVGRYFSVREIITPHRPRIATRLGFINFLPPTHLWPLVVLNLRCGDLMRAAVDKPVKLVNLWRPGKYDQVVTKPRRGYMQPIEAILQKDHPNIAGDYEFKSANDRLIAEGVIRGLALAYPELQISIGLGYKTIHVGILSFKGARIWYYKTYPKTRRRDYPTMRHV